MSIVLDVWAYVKHHPKCQRSDIASRLGISEHKINTSLWHMSKRGQIIIGKASKDGSIAVYSVPDDCQAPRGTGSSPKSRVGRKKFSQNPALPLVMYGDDGGCELARAWR